MEYRKIKTEDIKLGFLHELDYFEEYFLFNEKKIQVKKDKLKKMMAEDIQKNVEDEITISKIYYQDLIKLPSYFYHSSIVSLYALLESNLNIICEQVRIETNFPFGVNDLSGQNIIKKARAYLEKITKIHFAQIDKEWIKITQYQKLRNLIVHQNSQIRLDDNTTTDDEKNILPFKKIEVDRSTNQFYIKDKIVIELFLNIIRTFVLDI